MDDKASLIRGAFLFCVSQTGNLTIAAEFAGVTRAQMTQLMGLDAGFDQAVKEAMQEAQERVFYQAFQRGILGAEMPRFYQGEVVGSVRTPSDGLMRYVLAHFAQEQGAGIIGGDGLSDGLAGGGNGELSALRNKVKAKLREMMSQSTNQDEEDEEEVPLS